MPADLGRAAGQPACSAPPRWPGSRPSRAAVHRCRRWPTTSSVGELVARAVRRRGGGPAGRPAARRRLRRPGATSSRCRRRCRRWRPGSAPTAARCRAAAAVDRAGAAAAAATGPGVRPLRRRPGAACRAALAARGRVRGADSARGARAPAPDAGRLRARAAARCRDRRVVLPPTRWSWRPRPAKAARLLARAGPGRGGRAGRDRDRQHGDRDAGLRRPALEPACRAAGCWSACARAWPVKAITFSSQKWPASATGGSDAAAGLARPGRRGVGAAARRRRAGRAGPPRTGALTGVDRRTGRRAVHRWGGGLPQYAVGHLDRVARIRAAVAAVAGPGGVRRALRRRRHPGLHRAQLDAAADRVAGRRCAGTADNGGMVDGKQARELNDVIRYTAWSVFTVRRAARRRRTATPLAAEVDDAVRRARRQGRHGARHLRRRGAAGRRRPDDLVARRRPPTTLQEAYSRFRRTALGRAPANRSGR